MQFKKSVTGAFGFGAASVISPPSEEMKRSSSFKLGPRPRELKDQLRKTYRRNSFHLESAKKL